MIRTLLATVVTAAVTIAPVVIAQPVQAADPVIFTVGMQQDIDSLNPFTGVLAEAYEMFQLQYATLMTQSATDYEPAPGLAESWAESADGKTWTYTLRPGLLWSDGTPLTSADVVYTFNRILKGRYEQRNYGNYVRNISSVTALDERTVVMTVKTPTPIMQRLAVYILPEHIWSKIDSKAVKSFANEPAPGQTVVGSGPFLVVERRNGQFIRMVANDNYYAGRPKVDELVFRFYNNPDALGQALIKGEIDFAEGLSADVFTTLEGKEGVTMYPGAYAGFNELAFNTGAALTDGTPIGDGNPHLLDRQVRLAISHALNRQQMVDKILDGYGMPGSTIIPPLYTTLHIDPGTQSYDPALANQILDEAGYPMGPDGIRIGPDGKPMNYRLFIRSDSDSSVKAGEYFKSYLAAVGIKADIKPVDENALFEIIGRGDFDMFEWGWVVEPDPDYQLSTFTCGKRSYKDGGEIYADLSDSFYCNPKFDALYDAQSSETDLAKRAEIVKQMQQMLYEDVPYVVTWYYDNLEAYRSDRFTGFVGQPEGSGSLIMQYGTYTYEKVEPVTASTGGQPDSSVSASPSPGATDSVESADNNAPAPAAEGSSSSNTGLIIAILVGLIIIAMLIVVIVRMRASTSADDKE
ncbi:peptide ABC transporter substrate-binding protein [Actinomycetes bacterium]|nr:peptide ABC transporter substrate-binding protein [Actinomycetes bacterium]